MTKYLNEEKSIKDMINLEANLVMGLEQNYFKISKDDRR